MQALQVVLSVNPVFVRLITRIGPPPGCALGNSCAGFNVGYGQVMAQIWWRMQFRIWLWFRLRFRKLLPANMSGATTAGGWNSNPVYTVGSVTDIPISAIVSFVHNAV